MPSRRQGDAVQGAEVGAGPAGLGGGQHLLGTAHGDWDAAGAAEPKP